MSPEIWFFFTPDGSAEITVLNRESARQVARLMGPDQRQMWRVRKNRWPEAVIVADCAEIWNVHDATYYAPAPRNPSAGNAPNLSASVSMPVSEDFGEAPVALSLADEDPAFAPIQDRDDVDLEQFAGDDGETQIYDHAPAPAPVRQPAAKAVRRGNTNAGRVAAAPSFEAPVRPAPVKKRGNTNAGFSEKRKHPRFDARLRVVVIAGNRSFRSYSRNVSKGGLMLEHVVPVELFDRPCRVIIGSVDLKENIEFEARLAGDPNNPRSLQFFDGQDEFAAKLLSWIEILRKAGGGIRAA